MISQLSPLFHRVNTFVDPRDLLLVRGSWVKFSDRWPDSPAKWARGNSFAVNETPVLTRYPATKTVVSDNYVDLTLDNSSNGLKLYPEDEFVLYQIAVGLKDGDYMVQTYVPADRYVYSLGESSMWPNVTSATLQYLGAKYPEDTPADSPLWFLYVIKDSPAFILRLLTSPGVDYEKETIEFTVNKCRLERVVLSLEQIDKALLLTYYTELTGF